MSLLSDADLLEFFAPASDHSKRRTTNPTKPSMKTHTHRRQWKWTIAVATLASMITSGFAQERDRKVLFVGGQEEATQATDGEMMTHLQERYGEDNVSYKSGDSSATADAVNFDLIVISSTLGSGAVRGKFHRVETPVLNWEEALVDQQRAGNWPFTEGARTKSTEETLVIVTPDHPIALHLGLGEGPISVFGEEGGKTWSAAGPLPGDAFIIADTQSSYDMEPEFSGAAIFGVDKGGKLFDEAEGEGFTAPGKSIHYAMEDDSPGSFTEDGWKLFDACLDWLTDDLTDGSDPDVAVLETISFDLEPMETDQVLEIKIRSANTESATMLELSDFALSGDHADQFSLIEPFPSPIAAGSEAILKVGFNNERQLGTFTASLTFNTNDPDADDQAIVAQLVAKVPNPDGPFIHYRLDEANGSTEAVDSTTNENVAEYRGSVTLGSSGLKDGTGTSMAVTGGGQIVFPNGLDLSADFSISLWLSGGAGADLQTIVGQGDANPSMALLASGGDLQWFGGDGEVLFGSDTQPISAEGTHHLAMIYTAATGVGSIYVDGAEVASGDVGTIESDGAFFAGAFGTGVLPLDGTLDDIQIYNRLLTLDDELPWLISNPGQGLNPFRGDAPPVDPPVTGATGGITNISKSASAVSFGLAEGTYDIEYSEDLQGWSVIGSGAVGTFEDADTGRAGKSKGYYRGVLKE
jgi:hypothetical protein